MNPLEPVRMEIKGLVLDPSSNAPIVILRDSGGQVFLPIWIGVFEANAIALRMEGIEPPRPMTHDLLRSTVEHLGADVRQILISDLRDSTFYAVITLRQNDRDLEVDARPSDAIALALRTDAPIYVARQVLEKAKAFDIVDTGEDESSSKLLDQLGPDDLGKYTM
jgi:bifunctional DNase/RNase